MLAVAVVAALCAACLGGYWWLGRTATPGQRALEDRMRANRGALRRAASVPGVFSAVSGSRRARDAGWWTRSPSEVAVPEPDEHREGWRS